MTSCARWPHGSAVPWPSRLLVLVAATLPLAPATSAAAPADYPVTIVAVIAGKSAAIEDSTLVGTAGQLYRRSADGSWRRGSGGGLSADVRAAIGAGDNLIAIGAHTPVFRWQEEAWHARPLPDRGPAAVSGPGSSAAIAIGRHVYVLQGDRWRRVATATGEIATLWAAGPAKIWAADRSGGLVRLAGARFAPLRTGRPAGERIILLGGPSATELYALTSAGHLLWMRPAGATPVAPPAGAAGLRIDAIGPAPGGLLVAAVLPATGSIGERTVLLRAARGRMQLDSDLPALRPGDRAVALRGDADGGLLVATRSGRVILRRGAEPWTERAVSGALPATARSFPHAAPAHTR